MTDNEIIKALECCADWESDKSCEDCPENTYGFGCGNKLAKHSLDLINRQKAEIERLEDFNENLQTGNTALSNEILEIKSEAIKEFAERLKEHSYTHSDICGYKSTVIDVECIDNLLKEMTE